MKNIYSNLSRLDFSLTFNDNDEIVIKQMFFEKIILKKDFYGNIKVLSGSSRLSILIAVWVMLTYFSDSNLSIFFNVALTCLALAFIQKMSYLITIRQVLIDTFKSEALIDD